MNAILPIAPKRPAIRYHGGKWRIAPWIIGHFPEHRVFVEPYGGGASVLLRKEPAYAEVYNDLDSEIVNLFQVLRSPDAGRLVELCRLTPYAEQEFQAAYEPADDPLEKARRTVVKASMGHGSNAIHQRTGFRFNSSREYTTPAGDWQRYPEALEAIIQRLQGVIVMCRPAIEVMRRHDAPTTLHYVDPPYMTSTRARADADYAHEMTDADHEELLGFLKTLNGSVVLSGYANPLYDEMLAGWRKVEKPSRTTGAAARTETLWMNFEAA